MYILVIACYFRQIVVTNNLTNKRFARNIVRKPWDTADNEMICVIVFTFKTDTDDTMESSAIAVTDSVPDDRTFIAVYGQMSPESQMVRHQVCE